MKRRSQKEPVRDRELEQVKTMTTVTMTEADLRERLLADKTALEVKLADALRQRNDLRKACREHPDGDPFTWLKDLTGSNIRASEHLGILAARIRDLSAQLRVVKARLS